jgi:uncharacterized protein (DUF3084 family)
MQEKEAVEQKRDHERRNLAEPNQSPARNCKSESDSTSFIATISSQRGMPNAVPSEEMAVRRGV